MNEKEFDLVDLVIAVLAFAVENDEPFNVDHEIVKNIYLTMIENNTHPELSIMDENGRRKFGVKLVSKDESNGL